MPKFILDHGSPDAEIAFNDLDYFTQGYIEAAFWTETSDGADECAGATFAELAPSALASVIEDCRDFQDANAEDLEAYAEAYGAMECAGHDFWLTRNGHGAGFWDRGLGELGKRLTRASKAYGSVYMYRGDDGLIYFG